MHPGPSLPSPYGTKGRGGLAGGKQTGSGFRGDVSSGEPPNLPGPLLHEGKSALKRLSRDVILVR